MEKNQILDSIKNEWIEILGKCSTVEERHRLLFVIFPQLWLWEPKMRRELVFMLQQEYGLDFGIRFSIPGGEVMFPFVTITIYSEKRAAI